MISAVAMLLSLLAAALEEEEEEEDAEMEELLLGRAFLGKALLCSNYRVKLFLLLHVCLCLYKAHPL